MAMTKRLWSINALAVELEYDRRTVGQVLRDIRPDGELKGHPAWFIDTAMTALDRLARKRRKERPLRPAGEDVLADTLVDRLDGWREIYVEHTPAQRRKRQVDIEEAARVMGVEPADVLVWLRAGCPFAVEGDFATGAGFKLHMPWVCEWRALVGSRLAASQNHYVAAKLRMGHA